MCGGNEETGELRRENCDGGAAAVGGGKRWEAGRWVRRIWPIENPPSVVAGGDVSELTESVKPGRFCSRDAGRETHAESKNQSAPDIPNCMSGNGNRGIRRPALRRNPKNDRNIRDKNITGPELGDSFARRSATGWLKRPVQDITTKDAPCYQKKGHEIKTTK
jgi:hypothetical protein